MVYFYTMYSQQADENFWQIQKDVLLNWNHIDPPDEEEISRTWEIASYQQNKPNPFVVDPTLFDRVYFWQDILIGDINIDQNLDVLDLVQMITIIVNQEAFSNEELNILDANEDGSFNVLDIVVFVQTIVGE